MPPLTFSLLFPLGPKQIEYAAKFPVDVLWLLPKRVLAAKRDWEATVIVGGLVTSTALNLFLLPALHLRYAKRAAE